MLRIPAVAATTAALLGLLALTNPAHACSCARPTPAKYASWVGVLVRGEIVGMRVQGRTQYTWIRVRQVLKGRGVVGRRSHITVVTSVNDESCGYRFQSRGPVIAALIGPRPELETSLCLMAPLLGKDAQRYVDAVKASVTSK